MDVLFRLVGSLAVLWLLVTVPNRVSAFQCVNMVPSDLRVLHFDSDIIVIDKPYDRLSVPGVAGHDSAASVVASTFGHQRTDQMVVHRLDYATSGILMFARNPRTLQHLHEQFRSSSLVEKIYHAVVAGRVQSSDGEVDLPLGRDDERGSPYYKVDQFHGKHSLTHWRCLARTTTSSMMELIPITGRSVLLHNVATSTIVTLKIHEPFDRTHQLRLHMEAIGHAIVGDRFYAPDDVANMSHRLLLHAKSLRIVHPRKETLLHFDSEVPFGLVS